MQMSYRFAQFLALLDGISFFWNTRVTNMAKSTMLKYLEYYGFATYDALLNIYWERLILMMPDCNLVEASCRYMTWPVYLLLLTHLFVCSLMSKMEEWDQRTCVLRQIYWTTWLRLLDWSTLRISNEIRLSFGPCEADLVLGKKILQNGLRGHRSLAHLLSRP